MKATVTYKPGRGYVVEQFCTKPGDRWAQWHTLRAFANQGDAILFKELCNSGKLDAMAYIRSHREDTIVVGMRHRTNDPRPQLHVIRIENLHKHYEI